VLYFTLDVCTELSSQRPVVLGVHWTTPTNLADPFFGYCVCSPMLYGSVSPHTGCPAHRTL